jgi:hypothetical protein
MRSRSVSRSDLRRALVVNALAFLSSVFPVRGIEAVVPALVTLAAIVVLLSRPGRDALLYRRTT